MSMIRPPAVILALIVTGIALPAQARRSGEPHQYTIRCAAAECSDRFHYRTPRGEASPRSPSRRTRSRY